MRIVHIDVDPAEIGKIVGTHIPLVGDVREILRQMNEKIKRKNTDAWLETLKGMRTEESYLTGSLVNPKKAIRLLSDKLSDTAIMVADVGQNQFWGARHFEDLPGRKFMTSGGWAPWAMEFLLRWVRRLRHPTGKLWRLLVTEAFR